jgi:hypothetical protein
MGDFEQLAFKHGMVGPEGFDDTPGEVIFPLSAKTGTGFDAFKSALITAAPERPWYRSARPALNGPSHTTRSVLVRLPIGVTASHTLR